MAVVVGTVLALGSIPAGSTSAQTAPEAFIGYQASASGTALSAFPTLPALLPVPVPFEATFGLATATISSGGQGFGRASTFFPGTLTAGLRPLIETGGGVRLPIPDYPVVVEAREFEEAKKSEVPGVTMTADVDPGRAVAVADVGAIAAPAVVGIRSMRTESRSVLDGDRLTATSTSTLEGIEIGTSVAIGSLVSVASVTSDGVTATCTGSVTITGATVDGQPVTIDDEGVHAGGDRAAPGLGLGQAVERSLSASGLEVRALGGDDGCASSFGNRTTVGLLVRLPLPALGSIPAGGGLSLVLGSTSASAGGSSLPTEDFPTTDVPPTFGDVVGGLPGSTGGLSLPPAASPTQGQRTGLEPLTTDPASYDFEGIPLGLVVGLALLAFVVSRPLRRYMDRITRLVGAP